MNTILVADDDQHIRELECAILAGAGYATVEAVDGRDALAKLGEQTVDLVVLDVMMPRMDGYEFCELAKRYYEELPILMLTAKGQTVDKVAGLNRGADDYLAKPFDAEEFLARVRALLRRYRKAAGAQVCLGSLRLVKDRYQAIAADGTAEELPHKEFDLLFLLASLPGKTVSRERLLDEVWGYEREGTDRTLDVHINRLRARFPEGESGFSILTVRGLGYRLELTEQNHD